MLMHSRIQARREEAEAELARVGPPARRQRRTLDEPGSPGQSAVSAPRQPAQLAADPGHAARAALAHGMEGQAAGSNSPSMCVMYQCLSGALSRWRTTLHVQSPCPRCLCSDSVCCDVLPADS